MRWREGFHVPRGSDGKPVPVERVVDALHELPEPNPENLLDSSRAADHVLHNDLWSEPDEIWAKRGRLNRARHIIAAVETEYKIGGRTIFVRQVEFVRPDNQRARWAMVSDILRDPPLLEAYFLEIMRLQEQAAAKMARLHDLLKKRNQGPRAESRVPVDD